MNNLLFREYVQGVTLPHEPNIETVETLLHSTELAAESLLLEVQQAPQILQ